MSATKPPAEFIEWCKKMPQEINSIVFTETITRLKWKENEDLEKRFFDYVQDEISKNNFNGFQINKILRKANTFNGGNSSYENPLCKILINHQVINPLLIKNTHVNLLQITPGTGDILIELEDCNVSKLVLPSLANVSTTARGFLKIRNSWIGTLQLGSKTICDFDMSGGGILSIECPSPQEINPFNGSVTFQNVFLPRKTEGYPLKGAQPYRNMRYHLKALENTGMADLYHAAELAIERETDTRTNRILSRLYETFSDFGGSTIRPIMWLLLVFSFSVLFYYSSDGITLALDEKMYTGWRDVFVVSTQNEISSRAAKASIYAAQQLVNPLGIMGSKSLLIPKNLFILIWATIQSLISTTLLTLLILAIRRRFKLK